MLYYGDNLEVLQSEIEDESVDLIYLDPPFNSNASYNILFKSQVGCGTDASIQAFDDTWQWGPAAALALLGVTQSGNHRLHVLMQALHTAIGQNAMMAYLSMMAVRLVELHRVLKKTGSLYLHCDPTASHYLKLVLDAVFGPQNFVNEIVWKRSDSKNDTGQGSRHFGRVNDILLFYQKSEQRTWNAQYTMLSDEYVRKFYKYVDADGRKWKLDNMLGPGGAAKGNPKYEVMGVTRYWRYSRERMEELIREGRVVQTKPGNVPMYKRYLDETKGTSITSNWTDISMIRGWSGEKLGYPTQKPVALLDRIIAASSNPGDTVLDPFCGCGTTIDAAQKLGRRWIGIDITHLAIGLIEKRLRDRYADTIQFETIGVPSDEASALRLAADEPHEFQNWFCLKVGGYPLDGGRKGADRGIDGHFYPYETASTTSSGVISVKAGQNISVGMVRDLRGVMERDGFQWGLFLSAHAPTRSMAAEAAAAGVHATDFGVFPRLQIVTPSDLFHGKGAKLPPLAPINRRAARVETRLSHRPGAQSSLF